MAPSPVQGRLDVGGVGLATFEWHPERRGSEPPLLLVHATGFHARVWDPVLARLGPCHAIALDQRSHGRSDRVEITHWDVFGRDLAEVVRRLDLRDVVGVGHSMGGHALVDAAAALPDRFRRLVLVDPVIAAPDQYGAGGWQVSTLGGEPHPTSKRKRRFSSPEEMIERFRRRPPYDVFHPETLEAYCRHGLLPAEDGDGFELACPPEHEASIYMTSRTNHAVHAHARSLDLPVLVLRARRPPPDRDVMDFSSSPTWPGLVGVFRQGREVHLPEHTHFLPMEIPDRVAGWIREEAESQGRQTSGSVGAWRGLGDVALNVGVEAKEGAVGERGVRLANVAGRGALVVEGRCVDVAERSGGIFSSDPMEALARWDAFTAWAREQEPRDADPALDPVQLGPCVPRPRQVFAIGLNYRDHAEEAGLDIPRTPMVFTKFPSCITGPYAEIELTSDRVDWEVELVVVMGRRARAVAPEQALEYVAGYCVGQDISDRRLQFSDRPAQFSLGKSATGYGPIGPEVVSLDSLADPGGLALSCEVGGERMQDGHTRDMIFPVPELVSYLSRYCELAPGDLVFTGTPAGVGSARDPRRYLAPGDIITSEIEGLGGLVNRCVARP